MNAPNPSATDARKMLEDFADVATAIGIDISSEIPDFLASSDWQDEAYVRCIHRMRIVFGTWIWITNTGRDTLQEKLSGLAKSRSEQFPENVEATPHPVLDARKIMEDAHIFDRQVGGNRLRKFDRPDSLSPAAAEGLYCILQSTIGSVHALFDGGNLTRPTRRADKRTVAQIIGYLRRNSLLPIVGAEANEITSSNPANGD